MPDPQQPLELSRERIIACLAQPGHYLGEEAWGGGGGERWAPRVGDDGHTCVGWS